MESTPLHLDGLSPIGEVSESPVISNFTSTLMLPRRVRPIQINIKPTEEMMGLIQEQIELQMKVFNSVNVPARSYKFDIHFEIACHGCFISEVYYPESSETDPEKACEIPIRTRISVDYYTTKAELIRP